MANSGVRPASPGEVSTKAGAGAAPRLATAQPARDPRPVVRATSLAHLVFHRPDLAEAAEFFRDFGLVEVSRDDERLLLRGTGPSPCCLIVERGVEPRFVGLGLTVGAPEDLERLARLPGASPIEDAMLPGGGRRVRLTDPAGFRVDVISGRTPAAELPRRSPIRLNAPDEIIRIDATQRPPATPPEVVKLGHVLLEVPNYQEVCAWYTGTFGFIPSDVCVLPDGEPVATFFRLDLGDEPADHHTLALTLNFVAGVGHCAYEVVDADAVGMGQRVMRARGWTHAWGIGRHILGSQIFDYWQDPWGDKHEHYCDGDVFTAATPTGVYPVSREAMAQWGPAMPKSFTKPKLGWKELVALVRNLRRYDDLSIRKLVALVKLVA